MCPLIKEKVHKSTNNCTFHPLTWLFQMCIPLVWRTECFLEVWLKEQGDGTLQTVFGPIFMV